MTELAERTMISDPRFAKERRQHFASSNAKLSALQSEVVPQEATILNSESHACELHEDAKAMAKVLTEIDEAIEAESQNKGKKGKPAKGQPPDESTSFSAGDREVLQTESDAVSRLATACEMEAAAQAAELEGLRLATNKLGYIEVGAALHLETIFARPHFASEVFATLQELDSLMPVPPPPSEPALPHSWHSRYPAGRSVGDQAFRASWARGEGPPWKPGPCSAVRPSCSSPSLGGSRTGAPERSVRRIAPRIAPAPVPYEPAVTIVTLPGADPVVSMAASPCLSSGCSPLRPATSAGSRPLRPASSGNTLLRPATSNPSCRAARPSSSSSAAATPEAVLRPSASVPVLQRPATAASATSAAWHSSVGVSRGGMPSATSAGNATRGSLGVARPVTASAAARLPAAAMAAHHAELQRVRRLSAGTPMRRVSSADITTFLSGTAFDRDAPLSHLDPTGTSTLWHRRASFAKNPPSPTPAWSQRQTPQSQLFKATLVPSDTPAAIHTTYERVRPPPASTKVGAPTHSGFLQISPTKAAKVGPDAPQSPMSTDAALLARPMSPMAKLRAAGLAISAVSGMSGFAAARANGDGADAPQVLYSALGRVTALEMVAASQRASQHALNKAAAVKPKKPAWHNPNHIPVSIPPQRHEVRRKKLLTAAIIDPPSAEDLLEILQLTNHGMATRQL